jgi:class 3 adenylate cyclase/predicted ATPase
MKCPRCAHDNPQGARFCEECAAPLARTCSSCGTALSATAKFCHACAHPVAAGAGTQSRSPDSYTPKHLAEKILTSKAALEGERKQVTVLFADLKGSMELLADRDPEEARKFLDPVLELMMEAVHRYEGTVNQVMGDGIMALFGAPIAHEDHAVRACYAALWMQETIKRYHEDVRRTEGIPIRIRIGLNSGDVVVRAIGSDLHTDYTAVGQTTHLAARMEQLADPGTTFLTPETLTFAEGYIEVRSLGPTPVKGLTNPIEVYEMLGASTARSRFAAAAMRGLTKFVGRTVEMEQLSQALDHAKSGHGQVVGVVGEPGVGKSRLYYEFGRSHRVQGCLVIESMSVSYGKASAFLPVIELLKNYFRIEGRDDARIIREKVTGRLLSLDRALEPFLSAVLWLLDVSTDDPQWQSLEPPQRRQQTLDAVKRILLRESQIQPLVIVFEDLHWIDVETQALLDALVGSLPAARVLLLVNYRPEYQHAWGSKTYYRQLRIDPLPAASAHELLDGLLGGDATVQPLKAVLVQRTEGTPFFLEESVRALVETRVLMGERGSYRLQGPLAAVEVPATVKAVLAARIDRLQSDGKAVLQSASVIGTDVPFGLLHAIADMPEERLRRQLAELQSAEFLYESNLFPELEHTFKHALTHEVAYGMLLGDRRRAIHARIVEAIERLYSDRLSEHVEQLAHHAVRGELWDRAVTYLHEAGSKAFRRSTNVPAVAHFTQGLEILEKLPPGRDRMRQELRLLLALGQVLGATRGWGVPEVERTLTRARALGEALGESTETFRVLWSLWLQATTQGRFKAARSIAEELLALADRLDDPAMQLEARHAMWPTVALCGEPEAARRHAEQGMALYQPEHHRSHAFLYGGHDPGVCARLFSGWTGWMLGYPARALERSHAGLALARELSHQYSVALALHWTATVHQLRGDAERTHELAESLVALSTDHGFQQWRVSGTILIGWAQAEGGQREGGITQLRRGIEEYRALGTELFVPYFLSLLAGALLKHGDAAAGLDAVAEALKHTANGQQIWAAEVHRLKGELFLARDLGAASEAEVAFRQAIVIARQQGTRSWELRAVVSLGRLWRNQGKPDDARRMLAETYGWFTEGFETADLRCAKELLDALCPPSV